MCKYALALVMALAMVPCLASDAEVGVEIEAKDNITISDFYVALEPHGKWIEDKDLGSVWQPNEAAASAEWRPYGDAGHWVYTDAGWYWASDYKWGWAAFHYGRWHRHAAHGWVWVPDCTWAPAWVSWRESDEAYGWAPLPPGCGFTAEAGFQWHGAGVALGFEFGLVEDDFCFVPCEFVLDVNCWRHYCGHADRHRHWGHCVVRNEYRFRDGCIHGEGCRREHVEKHWGHKLVEKRIETIHGGRLDRGEHVRGRTVEAYRPTVKNEAPRKAAEVVRERQQAREHRETERRESRERMNERVQEHVKRNEEHERRQEHHEERREAPRQEHHQAAPPAQHHVAPPAHHH